MKKTLLSLVTLVVFVTSGYAQSTQYIPYQAVARDAAGNLVQTGTIALTFTISDVTGTLYQETQSTSTNNLGLFTASIGNGTRNASYGTYASIPWGNGNAKFMDVKIQVNGGSVVDMGSAQMMSVPYALYAGTASSVALGAGAGIAVSGNQVSETLPFTSLSTSGTGGAAGISGGVLTIPTYQSALTFSQPLSNTSNTVSIGYDNSTIKMNGSNQLYAVNAGTVTSVTASNGLTSSGGATPNITLGGTFTQATTVTQAGYTLTHNLTGTGDFEIAENSNPSLYILGNHGASTDGYIGIGNASPVAPLQVVNSSSSYLSNGLLAVYQPNLTAGTLASPGRTYFKLGVSQTTYNEADLSFNYVGSGGSTQNFLGIGFNDVGPFVAFTANATMGVGTTNPASLLQVNGTETLGMPSGGTGATPATGTLAFDNSSSTQTVSIAAGNTTTSYGLTLPLAQGGNGTVLSNNGSGVLSWSTPSSLVGSGTVNVIPKWNAGGTTIGNSSITDNGITVSTTEALSSGAHSISSGTQVLLSAASNTAGINPEITLNNNGNTNANLEIGVPTTAGNYINNSAVNDVIFRQTYGGKMLFSTSTSGATNDLTLSAGKVGIGTASPTELLQLVGSNTTSSKAVIISSDANYGQIQVANTATGGEASIGFISGETTFGDNAATANTTPVNGGVWTMGAGSWGNASTTFALGNIAYGGGNAMLTATSGGNVGIDLKTITAVNALDVNGGVAIGTYAGANAVSSGTLAVSGSVGIGNHAPNNTLEVTGASNSGGLRLTNLTATTATSTQTAVTNESYPDFAQGKTLTVNTNGDVVLQSPVMSESHYTAYVRWYNLPSGIGATVNGTTGVYTTGAVFPGTDEYGLPFVTTSTVAGGATNFPYGVASGAQPSSYYINPAYNNIDNNGYMIHNSSYYGLIYDFYFVYPTTGSYTFTFSSVDDAATLYTAPANDLNPAHMVAQMTANYVSPTTSTYTVSATKGDIMRARIYYSQGVGGSGLTMAVSGQTTNLMSLIYNIK